MAVVRRAAELRARQRRSADRCARRTGTKKKSRRLESRRDLVKAEARTERPQTFARMAFSVALGRSAAVTFFSSGL